MKCFDDIDKAICQLHNLHKVADAFSSTQERCIAVGTMKITEWQETHESPGRQEVHLPEARGYTCSVRHATV
jgi:hypothetical protein